VKEQVSPSDITVLVAGVGKAGYYAEIKDKPLPQSAGWSIEAHRVPDSVLVDTVSRFKGLESTIVFLWGLQGLQPEIDRESLYIGFSRAKSRLYLVGTEQICRSFLEYELESEEPVADQAVNSAASVLSS